MFQIINFQRGRKYLFHFSDTDQSSFKVMTLGMQSLITVITPKLDLKKSTPKQRSNLNKG